MKTEAERIEKAFFRECMDTIPDERIRKMFQAGDRCLMLDNSHRAIFELGFKAGRNDLEPVKFKK